MQSMDTILGRATHGDSATQNGGSGVARAGCEGLKETRSATLLRAAPPHPGLPQCRPRISSLVSSIVRTAEPRALALNAPPPQNLIVGRAASRRPGQFGGPQCRTTPDTGGQHSDVRVRSATLLCAASPHPGLPQCRPWISSLVSSIVRTEPRAIAPPRRLHRIRQPIRRPSYSPTIIRRPAT